MQRLLSELDIVHKQWNDCQSHSEEQRKRIELLEDEMELLRKQLKILERNSE